MSKSATALEKHRMERVAALGCIICGSPAQIHHIGTHAGGGRDHMRTIPLCVMHHTAGIYGTSLHAGKKAFEARYGTEEELLEQVNEILNSE